MSKGEQTSSARGGKQGVRMIVPEPRAQFLSQPANQHQWQLQLSLAPNRIMINSDWLVFERI